MIFITQSWPQFLKLTLYFDPWPTVPSTCAVITMCEWHDMLTCMWHAYWMPPRTMAMVVCMYYAHTFIRVNIVLCLGNCHTLWPPILHTYNIHLTHQTMYIKTQHTWWQCQGMWRHRKVNTSTISYFVWEKTNKF